ncbi:MAG: hypothetical protein D6737_04235 [Chloroflexi bacterium]|nr:MAG: hypothetical protein D6737_04235 [Chloroflexota bacterium]
MAVKNPKHLVIDASVMRAAGGENATYPVSKRCRDFMSEILTSGHSVIMTDDILEEWKKQQLTEKRFRPTSPSWYAQMRRKGKIIHKHGNTQNAELRAAVFAAVEKQAVDAVEKDMRLVEGALLGDNRIASQDERMRRHFQRAAALIEALREIVWVNPAHENENCIEWLRQSAPADDFRKLGYK